MWIPKVGYNLQYREIEPRNWIEEKIKDVEVKRTRVSSNFYLSRVYVVAVIKSRFL
jgi:hypothetical protein